MQRASGAESPRDLVVVYIPEYVVGHWWEQILHNQSALRLKTRLLFTRGVMVASVPWQLASSEGLEERRDITAPGASRRAVGPVTAADPVEAGTDGTDGTTRAGTEGSS